MNKNGRPQTKRSTADAKTLDEYPRERLPMLLGLCELVCTGRLHLQDAAMKLGISLPKASRLKREAEDLNILCTKYYPPQEAILEAKLQGYLRRYGFCEVRVCKASVPQMAARYFEENVESGHTVILDGGSTVRDFVDSLRGESAGNLRVVPICADPPSYEASSHELSVVMAAKYQSLRYRVRVPYSLSSGLRRDQRMAEQIARKADFVFLGVGPWRRKFTALEFVRHLGYDPETLRQRHRNVKAVCGYYGIDGGGNQVFLKGIDDVMPRALPFGELLNLARKEKNTRVVLLARSRAKVAAVKCAIRARIANRLIVDEDIAISLLNDPAICAEPNGGAPVDKK